MSQFLSRTSAAIYLTDKLGRQVTKGALEQHAIRGTGPRYSMILGRASYVADDLEGWVESLIAEPVTRHPRSTLTPGTASAHKPGIGAAEGAEVTA